MHLLSVKVGATVTSLEVVNSMRSSNLRSIPASAMTTNCGCSLLWVSRQFCYVAFILRLHIPKSELKSSIKMLACTSGSVLIGRRKKFQDL